MAPYVLARSFLSASGPQLSPINFRAGLLSIHNTSNPSLITSSFESVAIKSFLPYLTSNNSTPKIKFAPASITAFSIASLITFPETFCV